MLHQDLTAAAEVTVVTGWPVLASTSVSSPGLHRQVHIVAVQPNYTKLRMTSILCWPVHKLNEKQQSTDILTVLYPYSNGR